MLILFALTAFLSAALLFLVEPMFARMLLPLVGGAPAVWNTCVVFYQVMLLAGYLYAHLVTTRVRAGGQLLMQGGLLVAAALLLPVTVGPSMAPPVGDNPIWWLLRLLLTTLGLPFLVVAATGPLLQRWFAGLDRRASANPYVLYAAGNLGSLLALLAYPLLLEPRMRLHTQSLTWAVSYGVCALLTLACGLWFIRSATGLPDTAVSAVGPADRAPAWRSVAHPSGTDDWWALRLRWLGLSIVPSSLMLSVTTFISTDVAAVPLLWIVPLSLYLITFIIAFSGRSIIPHALVLRLIPGAAIVIVALVLAQRALPVTAAILTHLGAFFVMALGCHQALAESRPPASRLTEFYLWLSLGGAVGGVFTTLVAPLVFVDTTEYPLVAIAACLMLPASTTWPAGTAARLRAAGVTVVPLAVLLVMLVIVRRFGDGLADHMIVRYAIIASPPLAACYALRKAPVRMGLALASLFVAGTFARFDNRVPLHVERTFFGVHRVLFTGREKLLQSGTTNHGAQSVDPALACEPLTYYARSGPVGQLFEAEKERLRYGRIGVVGLGTATMAVYARPEQTWTFYEINPAVDRLARDPSYFTFLRDCAPPIATVLGDARLSLGREPDRSFDLLVLDAFSSDAIPVHLMTREAMALYLAKLAPGGLLAIHISNRYLELAPVVARLASDADAVATMQFHGPSAEDLRKSAEIAASRWVVVGRSAVDLRRLAGDRRWQSLVELGGPLWTDDYSNLWRIFKGRVN